MSKKITVGNIVTKVLLLLLLISILYPFLWLILSTFKPESDFAVYPPRFFNTRFTAVAYVNVWNSLPLLTFLKNTVIFAGSVMVLSVLFDSMAGYAFARINFKGKNALFTIVLITMMVPFQVLMIPLYLLLYKMHILNTFAGLILPRMADAFGIFLMRSSFVSLPRDLEEAARVDGFNEFQIFYRIMFPLCKPAVVTLCIMNLMSNWNDLLYPLILTSSTEMRTLSAGLATLVGQRTIEYGPTLASAFVSMLPLIVLYFLAQRYFIQGIATTGMKA
jgi:multiple sugar transport system permease protein